MIWKTFVLITYQSILFLVTLSKNHNNLYQQVLGETCDKALYSDITIPFTISICSYLHIAFLFIIPSEFDITFYLCKISQQKFTASYWNLLAIWFILSTRQLSTYHQFNLLLQDFFSVADFPQFLWMLSSKLNLADFQFSTSKHFTVSPQEILWAFPEHFIHRKQVSRFILLLFVVHIGLFW